MIANDAIDHAIGAKRQRVRTVLSRRTMQLYDPTYFLQRAVSIFVRKTIDAWAFGADSCHEDFAVEWKNSLNRFDLIAISSNFFGDAIFVAIKDQ